MVPLTSVSINSPVLLEVFSKHVMLRHFLYIFPVLLEREAHDREYTVQLIMVVRSGSLDVLLPAVEYRFGSQQLGKYTADSPDIYTQRSNK